MPDDFATLSRPDQTEKLDQTRAQADWTAANGPAGGVIRHLRDRAKATRRTARLFLGMLIVTILTGLGFYLGLPFWQTWADGRHQALVETLAGIETRNGDLDRDRKALMLGGELTKGGKAVGLPALLRDAFVAILTGTGASLEGSITHGDRLFVFGDEGGIRRLAADGARFEIVPTDTEATFLGAKNHGDLLFVFDADGKVRRLADNGARFEDVPTGTDAFPAGAITYRDRLFVFGADGKVRRLAENGARFEEVPSITEAIPEGAIIHDNLLFVFGDEGNVRRLSSNREKFEDLPTNTQANFLGAITHGGRLFVFGTGGVVRRLGTGGARFENVPTGTEADLLGAITYDNRLFVFGDGGTVRRLAADGAEFEDVPNSVDADLKGAIAYGGRLFVFGTGGTVLRLAADGADFEGVPTGTQAFLVGATNFGDRLFVFGSGGTVSRLAADGTGFEFMPTGTKDGLSGATIYRDRLFMIGALGDVIATSNAFAETAATLPTNPGEQSRATVEAFLDQTLPQHLREWNLIQTLRNDLRLVASERAGMELIEARARADLTQLDESPLQYLRDRKALDFKAFLDNCRGVPATEGLTTSCLTAWQSEQAAGQRSWWETLADQVPPGILLLFLLATLGGLYRYNLRLAGFHESRADALQLLAQGRDVTQLRDILAATPGEAVNLATLFLAADKVEMGTIRAKLGQAEIELAKALNSSE